MSEYWGCRVPHDGSDAAARHVGQVLRGQIPGVLITRAYLKVTECTPFQVCPKHTPKHNRKPGNVFEVKWHPLEVWPGQPANTRQRNSLLKSALICYSLGKCLKHLESNWIWNNLIRAHILTEEEMQKVIFIEVWDLLRGGSKTRTGSDVQSFTLCQPVSQLKQVSCHM